MPCNEPEYLDRWDIKPRAIQIFHTEENQLNSKKKKSWNKITLNPNGRFRSIFDIMSVVWVLYFVFMNPFELDLIGI